MARPEPSTARRVVAYVAVAVSLLVPTVVACTFLARPVCLGSEGHPVTSTSPRRVLCDPPLLGDLIGIWSLTLGAALLGLLATAPLVVRAVSTPQAMRLGFLPPIFVATVLALTLLLPRS